jgi:hypothetical protein
VTTAKGLKQIVRSHVAPFKQRQKPDLPSLTLLV